MAKKLLEEATVRRFMKIAGIKSLNENFAQELEEEVVEEMYKEGEEEEEESGMEAGGDMGEPEMEEMPEEEPADAEMPGAPEPAGEEEVELEVEGGKDEAVELLAKLADMLGVEVEVEGDEGGEEPEMEEPEMEEPEMEEPSDEEMPVEEEVMEEGEHMEEPAKDPAGHSLENPPLVDDADSKDPNQNPSTKEQDPMKASGEHMAESREAFKKRLVEQVAKRVAARLKNLK